MLFLQQVSGCRATIFFALFFFYAHPNSHQIRRYILHSHYPAVEVSLSCIIVSISNKLLVVRYFIHNPITFVILRAGDTDTSLGTHLIPHHGDGVLASGFFALVGASNVSSRFTSSSLTSMLASSISHITCIALLC